MRRLCEVFLAFWPESQFLIGLLMISLKQERESLPAWDRHWLTEQEGGVEEDALV